MAEGAAIKGSNTLKSDFSQARKNKKSKKTGKSGKKKNKAKKRQQIKIKTIAVDPFESVSMQLARRLQELTGLESRVTVLGHLQRGGSPSSADRLLATRLGTACAQMILKEKYGVMIASRGDKCVAVPLKEIAGKRRLVPKNHPWIQAARMVGTSFGD